MCKNIGLLLKRLRKEENINLKDLCKGICSLTSLSRIELGERQPSKILFDELVYKLRKNSEKWELILSENDKELIYYRNYIDFLIKNEKWEQIDFYLEEYKKLIETDEELNKQYISTVKTIVYKENKEYNKAFKECIYALKLTKLNINLDNLKIDMIVCKSELKLLCLLGEILLEGNLKSILEVYYYWKEIFNYIEQKCKDEEYKLKFYIMAIYNISYSLYLQNRYNDSMTYINKGIEYIIENNSTYYLEKFLKLIINLKDFVDYKRLYISDKMEYKEIQGLLETINQWKIKDFKEDEVYIKPYNNVYSINEIIKNTRYYNKMTQEELLLSINNENIVGDQSAISNIENGKRTPRKKNTKHYLEALGIEDIENYKLSIVGEDFKLQEIGAKIEFYMSIYSYKQANDLLEFLKNKIDLNNKFNRQYIEKLDLLIKDELNPIPCEKYREEIFRILSITIKDIEKIKTEKWRRYFTKDELRLLLNIGGTYYKNNDYKEALKWYKKLEEYFEKFYPLSGIVVYRSLIYNLSQTYGLLGNYEKSINKSRRFIFTDTYYSTAYNLPRAVFNIGWCYGKLMLESDDINVREEYKKKCYKLFIQSYYIAKFYNDKLVIDEINKHITFWKIN